VTELNMESAKQSREFEGKVILLTGAVTGMGNYIARAFADRGAEVYASGLEPPANLDDTTAVCLTLDVTDDRSIEAALRRIAEKSGRLDVLVNAAGIHSTQRWGELDRSNAAQVFEVNAVSMMMVMQASAELMASNGGGRIVNIASIAGRVGYAPVAYSASKAAVINLTQSAALAYASRGIRVNAIAPGPIQTPMLEGIRASKPNTEAFDKEWVKAIPLGRYGEVADLVGTTMLLASDRSSYITGQTLNIDGGQLMN
jgi:3-oxoacyl-[acyl-carrier protein] reductase